MSVWKHSEKKLLPKVVKYIIITKLILNKVLDVKLLVPLQSSEVVKSGHIKNLNKKQIKVKIFEKFKKRT